MLPVSHSAYRRYCILVLLCTLALPAGCLPKGGRSGDPQAVIIPEQRSGRTFVFECGDGFGFVSRIEGENAWLFLPGETVRLPQIPSASGARYSDGRLTFWNKGEEALFESGTMTRRECRNQPGKAVWEDAKLRGVDFRAVGNEPGWNLEIRSGGKTVFITDYGWTRYEFATPDPVESQKARTTVYQPLNVEHEMTILLQARPCSDTMSGEAFETTVTVSLDGRTYHGCGRPLH